MQNKGQFSVGFCIKRQWSFSFLQVYSRSLSAQLCVQPVNNNTFHLYVNILLKLDTRLWWNRQTVDSTSLCGEMRKRVGTADIIWICDRHNKHKYTIFIRSRETWEGMFTTKIFFLFFFFFFDLSKNDYCMSFCRLNLRHFKHLERYYITFSALPSSKKLKEIYDIIKLTWPGHR